MNNITSDTRTGPGDIRVDIDPTLPDWLELHGLLTAAYAYMQDRIDPPSSLLTMSPDDLERKAALEHLIIASVDGHLIGCVFCRPQDGWLYIGKMATAPGWQRAGIGRLLISAARTLVDQKGLNGLELETRIELAENHHAFERLGFTKVAEHSHPGYTTITSVTMRSPAHLPASD